MNRITTVILVSSGAAALTLLTAPRADAQVCWRPELGACFVSGLGFGQADYFRYGDAYSQVTGTFGYGQPLYQEGAPSVGFEYPSVYGVPYRAPHDGFIK